MLITSTLHAVGAVGISNVENRSRSNRQRLDTTLEGFSESRVEYVTKVDIEEPRERATKIATTGAVNVGTILAQ
ncbi:hypothetical protein D3C81_2029050 [compost metagenome]